VRSAARAALVVVLAVSSAACASEEPSTEAVSTASPPTMATTIAPVASSAPSTSRIEPSWSAAPPLLRARSAHGVVVAAGALYAVGGTGEDGKPITEVERFDGAGWLDVTVLPGGGVNAPSVAAVDGRIYVIGGFTGTSSRPTDEVWVYDVASATWSTAAALPTASGGHAATVLDNKIHVIGGGTARSTIADHVVYDPTTDAWASVAPLPQAEGSPAAVVLNEQLWAIGGRSGRNDFGDVFIYDAATDAWSNGPAIDPRGTAGAVVACGTILLVGGESQATDQVLADVFALDGDTWVPLQPLLTPRSFARTVVLDDAVYVVGGSTEYGSSHASHGSSAVERFTTTC
jgi:N-acetylneuraminic acid mutarotase